MRNKLGEKAYETGILYIKLGAYDSAILAFEQMLENYYDTEYVSEAHLGIIRSYSAMEKVDKVENIINLINMYFLRIRLRKPMKLLMI